MKTSSRGLVASIVRISHDLIRLKFNHVSFSINVVITQQKVGKRSMWLKQASALESTYLKV
jgi:hypothetical protein